MAQLLGWGRREFNRRSQREQRGLGERAKVKRDKKSGQAEKLNRRRDEKLNSDGAGRRNQQFGDRASLDTSERS
jgi:hypothetical protein